MTPLGGTRTIRYGEFVPRERTHDTRPDPEDAVVRPHTEQVKTAQIVGSAPYQVIRGQWPADLPPIPLGFDAWINIYDPPSTGFGFEIWYETLRLGLPFRRAVNFGSESSRNQDWFEYKEPRAPGEMER